MEAEANEKVDLSIRHVHDFLNGPFGLVIVVDERQFGCDFRYISRNIITFRQYSRKTVADGIYEC